MEKTAVKFSADTIHRLEQIARDAKLEGVDILDKYSDEEKVESFNGTGGTALPEWKRYILTKLTGDKLPAVYIHDMQYRQGGTEEDRKKANRQLAENFIKLHEYDIKNGKSSPWWWWSWASRKAQEVTDREEAKAGWGIA